MASFTEKATLEVKDKSTAQIKKINAELKKLQATAKSLKSIKIELKIIMGQDQVQALTRDLNKLKTAAKGIRINVQGGSGLSKVQQQVTRLRQSAKSPINIKTHYSQTGHPPRQPRGPGSGANNAGKGGRARTVIGTMFQGFNAGGGGGMGLGLMGGLAAVNPAMLAVAAAAYAAAAALKVIGTETIKADRADLMMKIAATPEQQGIIQKAVEWIRYKMDPSDIYD